MATISGLTIEDFEKLPDALAVNHELVDGELVDVSGNIAIHNYLRDLLVRLLGPWAEDHRLGLVLSEQEYAFGENAHGPDLSFVREDRRSLFVRSRRVQPFVPDLAIEIASQNDRFIKLLEKLCRYLAFGSEEAWLFSIETRHLFVFRKGGVIVLGENDMLTTPLLPGFSIRVGELFDRAIQI